MRIYTYRICKSHDQRPDQNTSQLPLFKNLINVYSNHSICDFKKAFSISAGQPIIKDGLKFSVTKTNKKLLEKDKKNTLTKATKDCNNGCSTTHSNPDTTTNQTRLGFLKIKACIYNFFSNVMNKIKNTFNSIKQKWLSQSQTEAHFTDMATATISRQDIKTVNHQGKVESEYPILLTDEKPDQQSSFQVTSTQADSSTTSNLQPKEREEVAPVTIKEALPVATTETPTPITEENLAVEATDPPSTPSAKKRKLAVVATNPPTPSAKKRKLAVVATDPPTPSAKKRKLAVVATDPLTSIRKEDRLLSLESKAYIYSPFLSRDMIAQAVGINLPRVLQGKEPHQVVFGGSIDEMKQMLEKTKSEMIIERYNLLPDSVYKKDQFTKKNQKKEDEKADQKTISDIYIFFENLTKEYEHQLTKEKINDFHKENPKIAIAIGEYLALSKMTFIPMDQANKDFEKIYVLGHGTPANPNITSSRDILSRHGKKHVENIAPELNQLIKKQRKKDPNLKIQVHIIACDGANRKSLDSFNKTEIIEKAKSVNGIKPLGQHLSDALAKQGTENVAVVAYPGEGVRRGDKYFHKTRRIKNKPEDDSPYFYSDIRAHDYGIKFTSDLSPIPDVLDRMTPIAKQPKPWE